MKKTFFILPLICFTLIACQSEKVQTPAFELTVDSVKFHVGDTVNFHLSGNPDFISFYSGESGNAYAYTKQDRIVEASTAVTFQTQNRSQSFTGSDGGASYCQENQLKIHISTNFNGQYDAESVKNATWTDITAKFSIGPTTCNSTSSYISAGTVDLSEYISDEQPFYFAFQYVNHPNKDFGNCNIWRFSSFAITSVSDAGTVNVATQTSALWKTIFVGSNWDPVRAYSTTSTAVTMRADPAYRDIEQELWCISSSLKVDKLINVGQDLAVAIKSPSEVALKSYQHIYKKPGTYKVTFQAANSNIYDRKELVKEIEITVEP